MANLKFSRIFSDLTQILGMEERGYSLKKTRNLCSEKKNTFRKSTLHSTRANISFTPRPKPEVLHSFN